jgi:thioredoxin reductase (NADPH)
LSTKAQDEFYDLIVIGGGVAGLTAALYAAREGIETLIIEKSSVGGQAGLTENIANYPGFPDGISGAELAERFSTQARRFGVEILQAMDVQRPVPRRSHRRWHAILRARDSDCHRRGLSAIECARRR